MFALATCTFLQVPATVPVPVPRSSLAYNKTEYYSAIIYLCNSQVLCEFFSDLLLVRHGHVRDVTDNYHVCHVPEFMC